jgi:hypothetical protein
MMLLYLKIGNFMSAPSLIGTFRGIEDGQMEGETEGQVARKCDRGTYKTTDRQTGRGADRQGSIMVILEKFEQLPTNPNGSTCTLQRPKK